MKGLSGRRTTRWIAVATLVGSAFSAPGLAISGVCPDGSIFIVQDPKAIPCSNAKQVEPSNVPPLTPEFLPRPYGWEVFNRESDPNNPYNLVDVAPPPTPERTPQPSVPPTPVAAPPTIPAPTLAPPPSPAVARDPKSASGFALEKREVDDLVAIVGVLQDLAPATLVARDAEARSALQVRFARSQAFEARLARSLSQQGRMLAGPAVVFHVQADADGAFWGNLTFVQGHVAASPDKSDPSQFGLVEGSLGPLAAGSRIVGYAVLPPDTNLQAPLDVYWNDRRLTAVLSP